MALRAGSVGLEYEAVLEPAGAGRGRKIEFGPSPGPVRGLPQLRAAAPSHMYILVIKSYNNFYFELEKPVQSDNT